MAPDHSEHIGILRQPFQLPFRGIYSTTTLEADTKLSRQL